MGTLGPRAKVSVSFWTAGEEAQRQGGRIVLGGGMGGVSTEGREVSLVTKVGQCPSELHSIPGFSSPCSCFI